MSCFNVSLCWLPHGQGLEPPSYATPESAGMDLRAALAESLTITPGARQLVPCGFSMALPQGYEAQIRPRSGLAFKHGVTVLNAPGTIDADYRGEIKALLLNTGHQDFIIEPGMRIAQMVIAPITQITWSVEKTLEQSDRGQGGFGSTGVS